MKSEADRVRARYRALHKRLYDLVDSDPRSALAEARCLEVDEILGSDQTKALAAGVLIDAGIECGDSYAISEGVQTLRSLLERHRDRSDFKYSLANGLIGVAGAVPHKGAEWFLLTADMRREARQLYWGTANETEDRDLKARALTNLANALLRGYRYIEAYDYYMSALAADSTNGVALTGAVRVLLRFADIGVGNREVLLVVAARHLRSARANIEKLRDLAGTRALRELERLLSRDLRGGEMPDLSSATDYEKFIARHRLALSPTIEGLDISFPRWDSLAFPAIVEPLKDGSGVPPIFAMFNTLKSDYLAARLTAFRGITCDAPETGTYSDTLDYAVYGVCVSLLTLAQRACYDLLDKIAVAASYYLGLPGKPTSITFGNAWFRKGEGGRVWRSEIAAEIAAGTMGLVALSEVSDDVESGGFHYEKRVIRRSVTHRFAVLHDMGAEPSRRCRYIDHFEMQRFRDHVIDTLRLARAALFYFFEVILWREARLSRRPGTKGQMYVPDHDWIRGHFDTGA